MVTARPGYQMTHVDARTVRTGDLYPFGENVWLPIADLLRREDGSRTAVFREMPNRIKVPLYPTTLVMRREGLES